MNIKYDYLRPKKAEYAKNTHKESLECRTELCVEIYKNAVILPLKKCGTVAMFGCGGVVDSNGNYVELSAVPQRVCDKYDYDISKKNDSRVVYCGCLINHWGHFLMDQVSRLWFFLHNDNPSIDYYVFTVKNNANKEVIGNYREFFELLGIWSKILVVNEPTQFSEVIVPERSFDFCEYYSPQYKEIFDVIGQNAIKQYNRIECKKIFLSRSRFKKAQRHELGMEMLDNYFKKNGYTIIFPETLGLGELVAMMRTASVCATCSGSTALNLLFANDNAKAVIMERISVLTREELVIDIIRNLSTTYVDANYSLYPVNVGSGPVMYAFTSQFMNYSIDNDEVFPDDCYLEKRYLVALLRKYVKKHRREYGHQWGVNEKWHFERIHEIFEAYEDCRDEFAEYIIGGKPLLIRDIFSMRCVKGAIKRLLKY